MSGDSAKPTAKGGTPKSIAIIGAIIGVLIATALAVKSCDREESAEVGTSRVRSSVMPTEGRTQAVVPAITVKAPLVSSCAPFSEQEIGCDIEPDERSGSGWIYRAKGTDTSLYACWNPRRSATHEDGTPVFSKIEYLDANGAVQTFDPEKRTGPASAYNFYATRKTRLSYNLAETCRPEPTITAASTSMPAPAAQVADSATVQDVYTSN